MSGAARRVVGGDGNRKESIDDMPGAMAHAGSTCHGRLEVNIRPYLRRLDRLKLRCRGGLSGSPAWSAEQSERLITPGELDRVRRQNN
jgi:hypothetical protein